MCKAKGQGRRCPETPQRKEMERYRYKVKYRASKAGLSSPEWLKTEDGQKFTEENNPKLLNPSWEQEHQQSLARMKHENHPQVTLSNTSKNVESLKDLFLNRDTVRGRDGLANLTSDTYLKEIAKLDNGRIKSSIAIQEYADITHKPINKMLLHQKPDMSAEEYSKIVHNHEANEIAYTRIKDREIRGHVKSLDRILSERRKKQEITYRCIVSHSSIEETLKNYSENSIVKFDNYSSTSHSPSVALIFSSLSPSGATENDETLYTPVSNSNSDKHTIMFEVMTNAGAAIAHQSESPKEREVLLPRGLYFKVANTYIPTRQEPYKLKNPSSEIGFFADNPKKQVSYIEEGIVVVQLVECDKNGNVLTSDHQENHTPEDILRPPAELS